MAYCCCNNPVFSPNNARNRLFVIFLPYYLGIFPVLRCKTAGFMQWQVIAGNTQFSGLVFKVQHLGNIFTNFTALQNTLIYSLPVMNAAV